MSDRLFVDDVMHELQQAEARILSLESDLINYRDMVNMLLKELASQNALVERLTWKIRRGK